jgi:uncharacterized protein YabN with tetrapyrrole methylase and pyrophosphatase domain
MERARHIHDHASSLGFDWEHVSGVLDKVREETREIENAIAEGDANQTKRELGDLLFTAINLARFVSADPETELHAACDRFERRFVRVQAEVERRGRPMRDYTLDELDVIWEEVKRES